MKPQYTFNVNMHLYYSGHSYGHVLLWISFPTVSTPDRTALEPLHGHDYAPSYPVDLGLSLDSMEICVYLSLDCFSYTTWWWCVHLTVHGKCTNFAVHGKCTNLTAHLWGASNSHIWTVTTIQVWGLIYRSRKGIENHNIYSSINSITASKNCNIHYSSINSSAIICMISRRFSLIRLNPAWWVLSAEW